MLLNKQIDFEKFLEESGEIGYVETLDSPVVRVRGLPNVFPRELLLFENGSMGQVLAMDTDYVEVLSFSSEYVSIGERVARSNSVLEIPIGDELLGHCVDPFGHSIYPENPVPVNNMETFPIEKKADGISSRVKITEPLETGVTVVDLMVPLGRGQRELVIGDRKTGKTEFLLQTMLSQAHKGVICIYAAIGKKKAEIKKIESYMKEHDIMSSSIIVASSSLDSLGNIFITPYSAMTIAEYFKDKGRDVLLVMDDLTTHAKFYRELSLLAKRFPGRNSYPGDIFYVHSRLLERAGNFKVNEGAASISCLAVGETVEGNMSDFIITNLMSITDGHLFFDREIFSAGRRPSINYFLSVTRVGRQTQSKLRWDANRELATLMSLYEKTQNFIHFGAELSEGVRTTLETGDSILLFFNQPMNMILPINLQIFLYCAIWVRLLRNINTDILMKQLIISSVNKYKDIDTFKKFVDDNISNSLSLNDLLRKLTSRSKEVLSYLEIASYDK